MNDAYKLCDAWHSRVESVLSFNSVLLRRRFRLPRPRLEIHLLRDTQVSWQIDTIEADHTCRPKRET